MPPIVIAKPPPRRDSPGGALPSPAAVIADASTAVPAVAATASNNAAATKKLAQARLKILIRRLPPGLTEKELLTVLGDEWNVGQGKVDWLQFKPGKVSKDPSKPSRATRAYLRVTQPTFLDDLSDAFKSMIWEDARKTTRDPSLAGPPVLEFSLYQKVPAARRRNDVRQGLIDQDPDFIRFLESLTDPIVKPAIVDAQGKPPGAVTVTPLIQHLRDKKAAKAAKAAASKHGRQASTADKKATAEKVAADEKKGSGRRTRGEKSVTKKTVSKGDASDSTPANAATATTAVDGPPKKSKAPKILQKDTTKSSHSATTATTTVPATAAAATAALNAATPAASVATDGVNTARNTAAKPSKGGRQPKKPSPAATSTTTQAFLKHVNPSQGVTEVSLEEALSVFGAVKKIEIDKRKAFAFVDFAEAGALQAAIAASPVKVAQGSVTVAERKPAPPKASIPSVAATGGPDKGDAAGKKQGESKPHNHRGGRGKAGGQQKPKPAAGSGPPPAPPPPPHLPS